MFQFILIISSINSFLGSPNYSDTLPHLTSFVLVVSDSERPRIHFLRAVAAHQSHNKEIAKESCDYLIESFGSKVPSRYQEVAWLIREDLKKWEDLGDISARMVDVKNRLDVTKVDKDTIQKQKKIVELLDKKIKDLEDVENSNSSNFGDSKEKPAESGSLPQDASGKGLLDSPEFKKKIENWGLLPQAERVKIEQRITQSLPSKYKFMIENYFLELNKIK